MKKILLTALCFLALSLPALAQTMVVTKSDGSKTYFSVNHLEKVLFEQKAVEQPTEFELTKVRDYTKGNVLMDFSVKDGDDWMSLDIYGKKTATYLEAGVYNVTDDGAEMTVSDTSSLMFGGGRDMLASGKMTVADNEGVYHIDFDFVTKKGTIIKGSFEGKVPGYTSHPEAEVYNFAATKCELYSPNTLGAKEYYFRLNDANYNFELSLNCWSKGLTLLPEEGEYEWDGASDADWNGSFGSRTRISYYYDYQSLLDGLTPTDASTMKFEKVDDEGNYKLSVTFVYGEAPATKTVNIVYSGKITDSRDAADKQIAYTASAMKIAQINDGIPGEFYLKGNDADYTCEYVLDLFAAADARELPEGLYTYSEEKTPGTFGRKTSICGYNYSSYDFVPGAGDKVNVTKGTDGKYTVNALFKGQNGFKDVSLTYTGEIVDERDPIVDPEPELDGTKFGLRKFIEAYRNTNNLLMAFEDESGKKLEFDMYGSSAEARTLTAGTYTVASGNGLSTIDPAYSYYNNVKLKSGTMIVADNEGELTIKFDFVLVDDSIVKGYYKGRMNEMHYTTADCVLVTPNEAEENEYYFKFADEPKYRFDAVVNLFSDGTPLPSPGEYIYNRALKTPGNFGSRTSADVMYGNLTGSLSDATLKISKGDGDNYTFDMCFVFGEGDAAQKVFITYTGEIKDNRTPAVDPEPETPKYKLANFSSYGTNEYLVTFSDADETTTFALDMYTGTTGMAAGTYTISGANTPMTIDPKFSELNGTRGGIKSGTVVVTENAGVFKFVFDLVLSDDTPLKGEFEGKMNEFTFKASKCELITPNNPGENEYFFRLNDAKYKFELSLNLFSDSTPLPAPGTYLYSKASTAPGTFGSRSILNVYTPSISETISAATLEITKGDGEEYTFKMSFTLGEGDAANVINITYTGEITDNRSAQ